MRPTVKAGGAPTLEVHLFDFDRDIYGRRVQVRFLRKLRDEEKYPDLAALTAAIARDVDERESTTSRAAEYTEYKCLMHTAAGAGSPGCSRSCFSAISGSSVAKSG